MSAMQALELDIDDDGLQAMMDQFDVDGSGTIDVEGSSDPGFISDSLELGACGEHLTFLIHILGFFPLVIVQSFRSS